MNLGVPRQHGISEGCEWWDQKQLRNVFISMLRMCLRVLMDVVPPFSCLWRCLLLQAAARSWGADGPALAGALIVLGNQVLTALRVFTFPLVKKHLLQLCTVQ